MSDHLNFDTDFLNNAKAPSKPKVNSPKQSGGSGGGKDTVKKWAWGIAIVVGIIVISALFDDSSSTSTYTPPPTQATTQNTDDNTFTYNGQTFRCSDYHYDRAIALRPDATLSAQIDSEGKALDARLATQETERRRIDNMYVDEYDQDSLDTYNYAVDNFNLKNSRLKSDIASWNIKNESFNTRIDTYNSYLDANCRPQ